MVGILLAAIFCSRDPWLPASYHGSRVAPMPRGKPSPKLAISMAPDVHEQVLAAAARRGVSVSAWITDAARLALKIREGLAAVAEWEAEHGALTEAELEAARQRLESSRVRPLCLTPSRGRPLRRRPS
jgi:hypothetical protein